MVRRLMVDWLKGGAAVIAAFVIAIGGTGAVLFFMFDGILTADQGLPILTFVLGGATGFLWAKATGQSERDAFQEGLQTPVPPDAPEEPNDG